MEPRRLASYTLLEPIGHGGMAVVYRAHQESLDRTVAVKVLSESLAAAPEFLERFRREARTAANLRHPNLITVHDFGEDERGVPYLVLEYIEGATLADLMDAGLDDERIPDLLDQIAAGLDYAHARGVIHRDIKPGNVLMTADGRAVLADFGLAWLLESAHLTLTGGVIGTPEYMSPEQAAGDPIDYRSDVYALGVVLFEMLAGERPFEAESPIGLLLKHLQAPVPSVRALRPELSPAVDEVVHRALAKDPDDRFASAGELARALRQAFCAESSGSSPDVTSSAVETDQVSASEPSWTSDSAPANDGSLECPACAGPIPPGAGICPGCTFMIPLEQLMPGTRKKLETRELTLNLLPHRLRWDSAGLADARQRALVALDTASVDGWEPASIGDPIRLLEGRTIGGRVVRGAILNLQRLV